MPADRAAASERPMPPATEKRAVRDTYHGTEVVEDYRWLEDSNDAAVKAWSDAQNAYARLILDKLPGREAIERRVSEIMSAELASYWGVVFHGGKYFAMKEQPPKQQPFLVVSDSLDDLARERVLYDPNTADEAGSASIVWFQPSFDGKLVAVCVAHGGAEIGDVFVYDTATAKQVGEMVPRVNTGTAGGDLAWAPDGSGFYYTRHPRDGERPAADMTFYQQVYFHKLGTPTAEDRYELGKDSPRIAETELKVDERTGRVLATIQNGDGGEFAHYLRTPEGRWRQFSKFEDKIIQAEFGPGDDLFVVTRQGAPRGKVVRVPIGASIDVPGGDVIVPEGDDAIVTSFWRDSTVLTTDSRLYVVYQLGGPSEIRVFDLDGKPQTAPEQLPVSSVGHLVRLEGDDVLFENESYVQPAATYRYDAAAGKVAKAAFKSSEPVNLDDAEVVREFATSKDGTKVPVNIIFRKGTPRDGQNPALVTGYGGYGVNYPPGFRSLNRVLLDHGFVIGVANIRGGGEFGEAWHLEGNLTKKQNVFDDFAALLEHLIERKYTSSDKLAIIGGSNGGLLMGAILTQHPALVRAIVASVGIYDMLRVELSANGEFNITEFGTVKNPDHFKALRAYSPYHNVRAGTDFPAVLFLTGANDPRVEPMQSRKMTARLQAASPAAGPFLLRTSDDSGHGSGTPLTERIAQQVDIYAFLFDQLGVPFEAAVPAADK
ncbi:MAG: S9 family peptidase [Pirellulales bacterium]|nr:S9 family peptidase [Pirellulales bacterium]